MKQKLNCILLIDDCSADNFLHELVINRANVAESVIAVETGPDALAYLTAKKDKEYPQPNLIFLDLNMPGMNGWEFLEEYNKLIKDQQGKDVVVMLTTSDNPDDIEKAKNNTHIDGFNTKPLTLEMLQNVLEEHFTEWL